jgi:hypothetical protein
VKSISHSAARSSFFAIAEACFLQRNASTEITDEAQRQRAGNAVGCTCHSRARGGTQHDDDRSFSLDPCSEQPATETRGEIACPVISIGFSSTTEEHERSPTVENIN